MDRTVKIRAFAADAKQDGTPNNQSNEQSLSLELSKKNAMLEEEKKKTQEYQLMVAQLRESLKLEQTRTAEMVKKKTEMEAKVKELSSVDSNEMAKKNAEIEELQNKSLENVKAIMQLRESNKHEQAQVAALTKRKAELKAKVKELSDLLGKISEIAAAGRSA